MRNKHKNGKKKVNKSMNNKFKIVSIELLPKVLILLSSRESTKMNLYGLEENHKSRLNNTKISIKMFLKKLVILFHTLTLQLKDKLSLLVLFSFQKEHLMINLRNFMKRNQK